MSRNENFEVVAKSISDVVLQAAGSPSRSIPVDEAKSMQSGDSSIHTLLNAALTKMGEVGGQLPCDGLCSSLQNVVLRRVSVVHSPQGVVGGYVHNFGSYGAVVELKSKDAGTALNPEKMTQYQEFCSKLAQHIVASDPGDAAQDGLKKLGKQQYVFDSSMNINQLLVKTSKAHGQPLEIAGYLRWKCGAA